MKKGNSAVKPAIDSGNTSASLEMKLDSGAGLIKLKIDAKVFEVLKRKRRARETIRMALERAIMDC